MCSMLIITLNLPTLFRAAARYRTKNSIQFNSLFHFTQSDRAMFYDFQNIYVIHKLYIQSVCFHSYYSWSQMFDRHSDLALDTYDVSMIIPTTFRQTLLLWLRRIIFFFCFCFCCTILNCFWRTSARPMVKRTPRVLGNGPRAEEILPSAQRSRKQATNWHIWFALHLAPAIRLSDFMTLNSNVCVCVCVTLHMCVCVCDKRIILTSTICTPRFLNSWRTCKLYRVRVANEVEFSESRLIYTVDCALPYRLSPRDIPRAWKDILDTSHK